MTEETFDKAKSIMDDINDMDSLMNRIKKIEKREGDSDFNYLRQTAFDLADSRKEALIIKFKSL